MGTLRYAGTAYDRDDLELAALGSVLTAPKTIGKTFLIEFAGPAGQVVLLYGPGTPIAMEFTSRVPEVAPLLHREWAMRVDVGMTLDLDWRPNDL